MEVKKEGKQIPGGTIMLGSWNRMCKGPGVGGPVLGV